MDAELKAKWVAALRSGEFTQATEALHKDGGYCCLGVLCVVAGLSVVRPESFDAYEPIFNLVGGKNQSSELSMRNDGYQSRWSPEMRFHQHSFSEIADYIEANL